MGASRPQSPAVRALALPQQAVDLLSAEHKKHPRNPYLFPSPKAGTMYDSDAFRRTHDKILKAIGAEHIRFHDLRHTFASILINQDVPLLNVSTFLGHSDLSTTANIYAHLDKSKKQESADVISSIFNKAKE